MFFYFNQSPAIMPFKASRLLPLFVVIIVCICCFPACKNSPKADAEKHAAVSKNSTNINPLDSLEIMFDNDNWMSIDKRDTSYYYFSRTEPNSLKIYHYFLLYGDSVNTVPSLMKLNNGVLNWETEGKQLKLDSIGKNTCKWIDSSRQEAITFTKTSVKEIEVTNNNNRQVMKLRKTLTLSSFLTRSHYDYEHHTRLAFEDTVR